MHAQTLTQLIPLLQIAIAPVILISGVGLILSLIFLIQDINLSLPALKLELKVDTRN